MAELASLGVTRVPIVKAGERWVRGEYFDQVAALVGIDYVARPTLAPPLINAKLDRILAATAGYANAFPAELLAMRTPHGGGRDVRELAHHILIIPIDFFDAIEGAEYKQEGPVPEWIVTPADLAEYGAEVRRRTAQWYAAQTADSWQRVLRTTWGERPILEYFERTAWHCGQHARQLAAMLDMANLAVPNRLTEADFDGLPMPQRLWG
jgi:hypothetical protein